MLRKRFPREYQHLVVNKLPSILHVAGARMEAITFDALEPVLIATFSNLGTKKGRKWLACTCHLKGSSELRRKSCTAITHIIENPQLSAQRDQEQR